MMKEFIGFLAELMKMKNSLPKDKDDNIVADVAFLPSRKMTFLMFNN